MKKECFVMEVSKDFFLCRDLVDIKRIDKVMNDDLDTKEI